MMRIDGVDFGAGALAVDVESSVEVESLTSPLAMDRPSASKPAAPPAIDVAAGEWTPYIMAWKKRAVRAQARLERWRERALVDARRLAGVLGREFGVKRVYLFGSLLSGEVNPHSDIDLAVEGLSPAVYYRAWARLERETDIPVDLVDLARAAPSLVERVQSEGVLLYELCEKQG